MRRNSEPVKCTIACVRACSARTRSFACLLSLSLFLSSPRS